VPDLKYRLIRLHTVCALACMATLAQAAASQGASTPTQASTAAAAVSTSILSSAPFVGDDPVAIRDALAKESIHANSPSLTRRIEKLIHVPEKAPQDLNLARHHLDREMAFIVPVPYGVLYRSRTHLLTVDVDLSADDQPGVLLLKKTVVGPSGRGLVIAPEAKAKGYIQNIDVIGLKADDESKTKVHGRMTLTQTAFADANGDFAIAIICSLTPPYLSDRHDHSDPTDDEPTDITTRTSTLYTNVDAVWLVSPQKGIVLSKKLHLSK
jgi:hypothetical protein